jgi:long-chain acyl-CoA synthetase
MDVPSLPEYFLAAVDRYALPRAFLYKDGEVWRAYSSAEMFRRVAGLSRALAELGVRRGDRVGLLSGNRPEWHIMDFAALGLGAVTVPIYFRESVERTAYILNDSGVRVAFAAGAEQVERLIECRPQVNRLDHIIGAGVGGPPEALLYDSLIEGTGEAEMAEYRATAATVTHSQLATLIYTSGTTGEPKGVMLTHANLSSNALATFAEFPFADDDLALSFLPLAHVYERTMDYGYIFHGVPIAYVEQMEDVSRALLEIHPTIAAAVPRLFEKTFAAIRERGRALTGLRRVTFDWAMRVAVRSVGWKAHQKPASFPLEVAWKVANRLVYSEVREGLGGRLRAFTSGSAPLEPELAEFFWSVGIPVYEGYGLTETSPVVTASVPGAFKVGTVGKPIEHVEVRIAEDGEILVRGACVMQGYFGKPEMTKEAFTPDGWLRTGDIGRLDEDGYLLVTDRKKELLKTAGGKFVAPQPIENRLKTSPYISNAVVVGDRRRFVAVLLVPNSAQVEAKARAEGVQFASRVELAAHPWTRLLLQGELDRLMAGMAHYERPKRFAVLDSEFTFGSGELTYTMKLKRRVIEERHKDAIEALYADGAEPCPPPGG